MRYIEKSEKPDSLRNFKQSQNPEWNPGWADLTTPVKSDLHDALLDEQGHICCYCEREISTEDSHIEHIKPRSKDEYKHLSIEYTNLLASCMKDIGKKAPLHCGMKKKDWYDDSLFISPLGPTCQNRFRFLPDGQIQPIDDNDQAAKETILRLGLDIPKLRALRREILDIFFEYLNRPVQEKLNLIEFLKTKDKDGRFQKFCSAVIYLLSNYPPINQPTEVQK